MPGGNASANTAKANGNPANNPGSIACGNPCSIGNGNKYQEVTDFSTAGKNSLAFTRYYNSLAGDDPFATELGPRWRSNYDRYLDIISPTEVTAARGDGQVLHFTNTNGTWSSPSDIDATLANNGATWTLTDRNDTVETYTQLSSGEGRLQKITARNGYTQTLGYNSTMQLTTVTDSYGRKLTFTYDGSGQLTQVATPDALVLSYGYDANDMLASVSYNTTPATQQVYSYVNTSDLASITDENGNVFASWTYDAEHRALTSQHANGAELGIFSYDSDTQRTVTNALGQKTVYTFETLQGVPKIKTISRTASATVPAGTQSFTYDDNGYTASKTDWNGTVTTYTNDAHGNPLTIVEASGTPQARTTTIVYGGPNGRQPATITAPGRTTSFTYDAAGNVLSRTDTDTSGAGAPARTWDFTYDGTGHLLTASDPLNDVTTYTYTGNTIETVTDALGHVSKITATNGSGQPLSMTDPNGVVTAFAYDTRNRPVSRTIKDASGDAVTNFAYDGAGNLTALTLPDGAQLLYTYDAAHRVVAVKNNAGESINYTLDPVGNITQQQVKGAAIAKTQTAVFDSLGRMLKQIGAYNQTTTFAYDAEGNALTTTDALNNTTTRSFDALSRLVRSVDPLGKATATAYDAQDNLAAVTDARGLVTNYTYNGFGEVIAQSSPDTGTTAYTLDKAGNRIKETDARGVVTNRTFDKLNRVLTETYPAAANDSVTYAYDQGTFGIGRLASIRDRSGTTAFTYDARGNILSDRRTIDGKTYTTAYAYDLADRIVGITYPDGRAVKYTRDNVGRIAAASLHSRDRDDNAWRRFCRDRRRAPADRDIVSGVTYQPFGPVSSMTFGNGISTRLTHDLDYRLMGIGTQGRALIQSLGMAYDFVNDITSITDTAVPGRSQAFTYDANQRLLTATGAYGARGYAYDADGNRTGESFRIGRETNATAYAMAATSNRLTAITGDETRAFAYDAAGNLLTDTATTDDDRKDWEGHRGWRGHGHKYGHDRQRGKSKDTETRAYTYDSRGRNIAVTITEGRDRKTFTYLYNAMGQRVAKNDTHFIYDINGNLIAEAERGRITKEYIYIDNLPVADIDGNDLYYIHTDHLGAPQKMTDERQRIVWDRVVEPFGETADIKGSVAMNLGFPGQYHDVETGLDYNMFRTYDPTIGRYTQSDPIGLAGGINTYGYVGQNPVNLTDPYGLQVAQGAGAAATAICLRYPRACMSLVIGTAGVVNNMMNPPDSKPEQCETNPPQTAPILNNDKVTPRPDYPPQAGGRSGEKVKDLQGPPNSAIPGMGGRIYITDKDGKVVVDVDKNRSKDIIPGQGEAGKRGSTPEEKELLDKVGGGE